MSSEASHGELKAPDTAAEAFARMRRTLAGQTAAIEGFAARQQELHARDYTPDLSKIHERMDAFRDAVLKLDARPAMALTPASIAAQIEAAGAKVRASDHRAWGEACRAQAQAASELSSVTASVLTARAQRWWIGGAAAGAFVLGVMLCAVVPGAVDRSVPADWHWPARRAAHVMRMDPWSAGERMMQIADPAQWRLLRGAGTLVAANQDALSGCRERAAKEKKAVRCSIQVGSRPAG